MGYRIIYISKKTYLNIEARQLVITQEDKTVKIPVEDIATVLIEDQSVTISIYTLAFLAEHDVLVFICNSQHMPTTYVLPYSFHAVQVKRLRQQLAIPKPLEKQLWQKIIVQKISNQAAALKRFKLNTQQYQLQKLSQRVFSGDRTNTESYAAVIYFSALFGRNFNRNNNMDIKNKALNYSYAIIRGAIARSLVAHGFIPDLGIHHDNIYNNFNLADDFIEPYRIYADVLVKQKEEILKKQPDLTAIDKQEMVNLLNTPVMINGQKYSLLDSIEVCIESILRCIELNSAEYILLPVFQ